MAEISAALVKELRDQTGAPMMDCKRALQETNGDMEAAVRVLREKGMAGAAKRSDRATPEGKVGYRLAKDARRGAMVAVGCETEPVSNNDEFLAFAQKVLDLVEADGPGAAAELEEERAQLVGKLGENILVTGTARFEAVDVLHRNFDPLAELSPRIHHATQINEGVMQIPQHHEMAGGGVGSLAH